MKSKENVIPTCQSQIWLTFFTGWSSIVRLNSLFETFKRFLISAWIFWKIFEFVMNCGKTPKFLRKRQNCHQFGILMFSGNAGVWETKTNSVSALSILRRNKSLIFFEKHQNLYFIKADNLATLPKIKTNSVTAWLISVCSKKPKNFQKRQTCPYFRFVISGSAISNQNNFAQTFQIEKNRGFEIKTRDIALKSRNLNLKKGANRLKICSSTSL